MTAAVLRVGIALLSSLSVPFCSLCIIQAGSAAVIVFLTHLVKRSSGDCPNGSICCTGSWSAARNRLKLDQSFHCFDIAVGSRKAEPSESLLFILPDTLPEIVHITKTVLRISIAESRGFPVAVCGL